MIVRRYQPGDERALWDIYHDTTHYINGLDYTPEQCEHWAPANPDMVEWTTRLQRTSPFVAVTDEGELVGFAELESDGSIGFFYCHHNRQRIGIGRLLFKALESESLRVGLTELRADVSVSAKAFFLYCGFHVERAQHNIVCNSPAPNFVMRKVL